YEIGARGSGDSPSDGVHRERAAPAHVRRQGAGSPSPAGRSLDRRWQTADRVERARSARQLPAGGSRVRRSGEPLLEGSLGPLDPDPSPRSREPRLSAYPAAPLRARLEERRAALQPQRLLLPFTSFASFGGHEDGHGTLSGDLRRVPDDRDLRRLARALGDHPALQRALFLRAQASRSVDRTGRAGRAFDVLRRLSEEFEPARPETLPARRARAH